MYNREHKSRERRDWLEAALVCVIFVFWFYLALVVLF